LDFFDSLMEGFSSDFFQPFKLVLNVIQFSFVLQCFISVSFFHVNQEMIVLSNESNFLDLLLSSFEKWYSFDDIKDTIFNLW